MSAPPAEEAISIEELNRLLDVFRAALAEHQKAGGSVRTHSLLAVLRVMRNFAVEQGAVKAWQAKLIDKAVDKNVVVRTSPGEKP